MHRYILLNIDPPRHTKLRGIVSRGFTPRAIENLRDVIADLLGVPQDDRGKIFEWSNRMVAYQHHRRPDAGYPATRRPGPPAVRMDQRDQGIAGQLSRKG
jgi:cytochrome P450